MSETTVARMEKLKPKWVDYKTSILEIKNRANLLYEVCKTQNPMQISPALALAIALQCQIKVLEHINDDYLNTNIPWDQQTNLPSHPTIAADAGFFPKCAKEAPQELKSIAISFSKWSHLWDETLKDCFCGSSRLGFKQKRDVALTIMINHAMETNRNSLVVKQFLGITSPDSEHLRNHYQRFFQKSIAFDNVIIPFICKNKITFPENPNEIPQIECVELEYNGEAIRIQAISELMQTLHNLVTGQNLVIVLGINKESH